MITRSKSRAGALLALALAAGFTLGVAADRWLVPAPAGPTRIIRDMASVLDALDLTPDQRARAEAILEASAPRSEAAMRAAAERLRSVADSVDAELRLMLTLEQQRRMDSLRREPRFVIKRKTPGGTRVDTLP